MTYQERAQIRKKYRRELKRWHKLYLKQKAKNKWLDNMCTMAEDLATYSENKSMEQT